MKNTFIIDRNVSERISALKFLLVIGVIFIHMGDNYEGIIKSNSDYHANVYKFIIHLLSDTLAATAVPIFFLISSALFFKDFQPNYLCYKTKIKSRITSLVIPYLFWCLAYLIFKLTVQSLPFLSAMIGGESKRVIEYTLYDFFNALSGWTTFPISYQFWFIRDLIVMVFISPVIWLTIRALSWLVPIFLMVLWTLDVQRIANISYEGLLFFSLGCLVIQQKPCLTLRKGLSALLITAYLCLALTTSFANALGSTSPILNKILIIAGALAVWYSSDLLTLKKGLCERLAKLSKYSFFIYAAHEPLLGILVKTINKFDFMRSLDRQFFLYWFCPAVVVLIICFLAKAMMFYTPKFYATITGGRT